MSSPPKQLKGQHPVRRYSRRPARSGGARRFLRLRWIAALALAVIAVFAWAALARAFAPAGNTQAERFDAIIVLGTPVNADGTPRPTVLAHITEGVREYERGVAPRLIMSGGMDGSSAAQAETMVRVARAQGVPESALFAEAESHDTIQNACYSARIMKAHGWRSAEVVSSDYHLNRAGLIFSHLPIEWRVHAAPPLEPMTTGDVRFHAALETLKTVRYLVYGQWAEYCEP